MKVLFAGPDTDLVLSNTGEDRKEGVHLSDILTRMAWEKDKKYHPDEPKDYMTFERGHTWETVLDRALSARHQQRAGYRPEQLQEDGVWCSPDWVNPTADVQHEEWKATRKSTKNFEVKLDEWSPQAKSYLRVLRRRKLITRLVTRFRVWFTMGDWSFEAKGDLTLLRDYWRCDVEFTEREVDEQWSGVVASGIRFGLLKQEKDKPWEKRPSLEKTVARRLAGKTPARSRGKARVVTHPSGKRPPRSNSVS